MTEEPIWGFTGGANFSYFIKKQFAISLGVNFSQIRIQNCIYANS